MSFRIEKTKDSHGKDRYKVFYTSKTGKESLIAVNFNGFTDCWFIAKWSCKYKGISYLLNKELEKLTLGNCSIRFEYSLEKTIEQIDNMHEYCLKNYGSF